MSNNLKEAIGILEEEIDLILDSVSYAIGDKSKKFQIIKEELGKARFKIRSLLQEANEERITIDVGTRAKGLIDRYECPKCGDLRVMTPVGVNGQCYVCGILYTWPEQQEEVKEEAFEVVEYEHSQNEGCSTPCYNINSYLGVTGVGSAFCQKCQHFKGHHVEGQSIRCSAKKENS